MNRALSIAPRVFKFCISGGTAALVMLLGLYLFHGVLGVPYLIASVMSFVIAVSVNFMLQRRFAFARTGREGVHRQAVLFLGTNVIALGVNTFLLYAFVEILHLYYLLAQVLVQAVIAAATFLIYGFIFRAPENPQHPV